MNGCVVQKRPREATRGDGHIAQLALLEVGNQLFLIYLISLKSKSAKGQFLQTQNVSKIDEMITERVW